MGSIKKISFIFLAIEMCADIVNDIQCAKGNLMTPLLSLLIEI